MRRYYLKLSGTNVVSKLAYDNVAAPGSGGYTEVTQAVYDAITDMNDTAYTYSGGSLSSSAKTLPNDELRRRALPDLEEVLTAAARVNYALANSLPVPPLAEGVMEVVKDAYDTYPP